MVGRGGSPPSVRQVATIFRVHAHARTPEEQAYTNINVIKLVNDFDALAM